MAKRGGKRPGAGRPNRAKSVMSRNFAAQVLAKANCAGIFDKLLKSKNEKIALDTLGD